MKVRMYRASLLYATGLNGMQIEAFVSFLGSGRNGKGFSAPSCSLCSEVRIPVGSSVQKPFELNLTQVADMHNKRFILMTRPTPTENQRGYGKDPPATRTAITRGLYDRIQRRRCAPLYVAKQHALAPSTTSATA
jgi:hypothetical protein